MNRMLKEDLDTFEKSFPSAVSFLIAAHLRCEFAGLLRQAYHTPEERQRLVEIVFAPALERDAKGFHSEVKNGYFQMSDSAKNILDKTGYLD